MGVGLCAWNFISSATFSVSGYGWNIRTYPDGFKKNKTAYLPVYLCFCSGAPGVRVKCTFSLLERRTGKESNLVSFKKTFVSVGSAWGPPRFVEKSKLQELLSRNNDCLTIKWVLTVIKGTRTEDVSASAVPVPGSHLQSHFARMLKDGEGMDVTFSVGDQLFSAHRCVLAARSSVFKAELFGQMKETTMKRIEIDDMDPAIFEALLHFIYTDTLPSNSELEHNGALQHMLVAADRYWTGQAKG
jgi:speckle-type POZ protein